MDKLIALFWSGKASIEEKKALLQKIQYPDEGWRQRLKEEYLQSLEGDHKVNVDDEWFAQMLESLHRNIGAEYAEAPQRKKLVRLSPGWRAAVAAVLVIVAGVALFRYVADPGKSAGEQTARKAATPAFIVEVNPASTNRFIRLPDSSWISMSPGAALSYAADYGITARQIRLDRGAARFKVAGNRKKPFSVVAREIQTSALGTEFTVAITDTVHVNVKLLEGSVMVHSTPQSGFDMETRYLKPGQELEVNLSRQTVLLHKPDSRKAIASNKPAEMPDPIAGLEFNQQPLNKIFRALNRHYHVRIGFDETEMAKLWFTGSFEPTDSLTMVLASICKMNALSFRQEKDSIIIYKE